MSDAPQTKYASLTIYNVWRTEPEFPGDKTGGELKNDKPLDFHGAINLAIELVNEAQHGGYFSTDLSPVRIPGVRLHWTLKHNRRAGSVIYIDIKEVTQS